VSNPDLIDIGSNLAHATFDVDRDEVIARAVSAGVIAQIVTGADLPGSQSAAALAQTRPGMLWSTAGVHPHHASQLHEDQEATFRALLRLPQVVAVGECGLDYFRSFSPRAAQLNAFIKQLEWAVEARKPVFLHQREAHADFVDLLRDYAPRLRGGVAHCFTDGPRELEDYLQLGLSIGITGWICDERRGEKVRSAIAGVPSDRLMIETDAPYLLPRDLIPKPRSRRNEPRFLAHIAHFIGNARGETLAEVAAYTTANATRFFNLQRVPEAAARDS
jgi:TatD DNase family protein